MGYSFDNITTVKSIVRTYESSFVPNFIYPDMAIDRNPINRIEVDRSGAEQSALSGDFDFNAHGIYHARIGTDCTASDAAKDRKRADDRQLCCSDYFDHAVVQLADPGYEKYIEHRNRIVGHGVLRDCRNPE